MSVTPGTETRPAKRSSLGMMVTAIVLFGAGLGAGVGIDAVLASDSTAAGQPEGMSVEGSAHGSDPADPVVHNVGKFTVNLRGGGGARLLRAEVQVETNRSDMPAIESQTPVLRDAFISLASDYTYADLEGLDGKMKLRDELFARLNTVLRDARIDHVYFTEFVVQ